MAEAGRQHWEVGLCHQLGLVVGHFAPVCEQLQVADRVAASVRQLDLNRKTGAFEKVWVHYFEVFVLLFCYDIEVVGQLSL